MAKVVKQNFLIVITSKGGIGNVSYKYIVLTLVWSRLKVHMLSMSIVMVS